MDKSTGESIIHFYFNGDNGSVPILGMTITEEELEKSFKGERKHLYNYTETQVCMISQLIAEHLWRL